MCVLCQEEDLYFLYLERQAQAEKAARGETPPASASWLWPSFVQGGADTAPADAAKRKPSAFICDAPDSE
jgi:hypothetical protein